MSRRTWFRRRVESPLVLAALAAVVLTVAGLREVDAVRQRAADLDRSAERALAELAVETVAAKVSPDIAAMAVEVAGVTVRLGRDGADLHLEARTPLGEVRRFRCPVLPGGAPPAFGTASSREVPFPDAGELAGAVRAADHPWFRRDPGIALRHLECGTDLEDFALFEGPSPLDCGDVRTIVVPGHLWLPPSAAPLRFRLGRDVTVVVEGNLYLGRGIEIAGPGRLILVAGGTDANANIADLDGNGRWSSGDRLLGSGPFRGAVEGVGAVYLGLPRSTQPMTFGCGLIVAGAVHAFAPVVVEGPLATAQDPVLLRPQAAVVAAGARLFQPGRERVPGFASSGGARCGLPVPAGDPSVGGHADREQALYLAAPAR